MAGITTSPQLRESPETANVQVCAEHAGMQTVRIRAKIKGRIRASVYQEESQQLANSNWQSAKAIFASVSLILRADQVLPIANCYLLIAKYNRVHERKQPAANSQELNATFIHRPDRHRPVLRRQPG